jgi:hypothetical protein
MQVGTEGHCPLQELGVKRIWIHVKNESHFRSQINNNYMLRQEGVLND